MSTRLIGVVKRYDRMRAFGFLEELRQHGTEQFFHLNDVIDRTILREGDLVTFEVQPSRKKPGLTEAVKIRLSKRDDSSASLNVEKGDQNESL